jgi:FKBP-type peptidyl-prolyl cis-trans isomerase FkpA
MKQTLRFSIAIILSIVAVSCNKEKKSQDEIDNEIILKYISDNNLDMKAHYSGIYFDIAETGTGGSPNIYSDVSVLYKGYLTDGTVFDQASSTPVSFALSGLIDGWKIAIPMLQKGGKGTFIIPSPLGYGDKAIGSIPANSVLIFEITLVDFY